MPKLEFWEGEVVIPSARCTKFVAKLFKGEPAVISQITNDKDHNRLIRIRCVDGFEMIIPLQMIKRVVQPKAPPTKL